MPPNRPRVSYLGIHGKSFDDFAIDGVPRGYHLPLIGLLLAVVLSLDPTIGCFPGRPCKQKESKNDTTSLSPKHARA